MPFETIEELMECVKLAHEAVGDFNQWVFDQPAVIVPRAYIKLNGLYITVVMGETDWELWSSDCSEEVSQDVLVRSFIECARQYMPFVYPGDAQ